MTLDELFNLILIRAGEFVLGSDNIELDSTKFQSLVSYVLNVYSKYKPIRKKFQIILSNYQYTFTDNPPEFITDVVPTFQTVFNPLFQFTRLSDTPPVVEWDYRKPTLYTNFNGEAEVTALYYHQIDSDGNVPDINDEMFYDLLTGHFLLALARSRRAFTLQELPITTDAEILASEGKDLIDDTMQKLQQSSILI